MIQKRNYDRSLTALGAWSAVLFGSVAQDDSFLHRSSRDMASQMSSRISGHSPFDSQSHASSISSTLDEELQDVSAKSPIGVSIVGTALGGSKQSGRYSPRQQTRGVSDRFGGVTSDISVRSFDVGTGGFEEQDYLG